VSHRSDWDCFGKGSGKKIAKTGPVCNEKHVTVTESKHCLSAEKNNTAGNKKTQEPQQKIIHVGTPLT
jgi:hypothetical protein